MISQSVLQCLDAHSRKFPALASQVDYITLNYKEKYYLMIFIQYIDSGISLLMLCYPTLMRESLMREMISSLSTTLLSEISTLE